MSNTDGIESSTDRVLLELLKHKEFTNLLEKRIENLILSEHEVADEPPPEPYHTPSTSYDAVNELICNVDNAVELFVKSEHALFYIYESSYNRQFSFLYDVQVFLNRLESSLSTSDQQTIFARALSCARRLSQLVRHFTINYCSVNKTINIIQAHNFATSMCDMIYRLEDILLLQNDSAEISRKVRKCADDFNRFVLNRILMIYKEKEREKLKKTSSQISLTPKPAKRKPLIQVQGRSPGFLMSPQLIRDRQRIRRTRSLSATCPKPKTNLVSDLHPKNADKIAEAAKRMEKKWDGLFVADSKLRSSISREATSVNSVSMRLARRVSAEVVRELRKKIGPNGVFILE